MPQESDSLTFMKSEPLWKHLPASAYLYSLMCTLGQAEITCHFLLTFSFQVLRTLITHIIAACSWDTMCNPNYEAKKAQRQENVIMY